MLKCLIVLCVGTTLLVTAAPAPQQNTIDFLLDLNQDVLDKEEVQASVKPISQAQVGTTTEKNGRREPAPVFEAQADVQEIPRETGPTASPLNRDNEEVEGQEDREDQENQDIQEEDSESNSEDDSEQKDQQAHSKDTAQGQDHDQDQDRKEDTTIRVYGPEDENDENDESLQQKEQKDLQQENERKVEPEVQHQPKEDTRKPQPDSRPVQVKPQQPEVVLIGQHADTVKQFDEVVDQRGTDLLQEIDQVTIPEDISEQPDSLGNHQDIEVKPDQLFNHGSIVFDKSTFADEDLPSTTPFSNKKWNHDHGPPGFGPWHPKFPGDFPGHPHGDESGRPPFFGMPPFSGPPPRFDGPPHWHFHNHSHDHDHEFHGHGFHRGGPWKWNRS